MSNARVLKDRYRLVYQLGAGGMGSVWLAEDQWLQRPVAIKELTRLGVREGDLEGRRQRVFQEARALARVRHPAIVPIHDLFIDGGDPWIVMEYISGRSLDKIIRDGHLDQQSIVKIGRHVLSGLTAVHRAAVVHRDVKPANILVADDGSVFLVDFGIARIGGDPSLTGQSVVGTIEYMAPERLKLGAKVGPPADVWALGVTFFYALEGYSPFTRDRHGEQDWEAVAAAISQYTPELTTKGPLADITLRMLDKDPEQRATTGQIESALKRIADGSSQPGRPAKPVVPAVPYKSAGSANANPIGTVTRPFAGQLPERGGLRDEIMRVGPDTAAAMLLTIEAQASAKILADCPPKRRGELLQGIAAIEPGTAATILRMLLDTTAGSAFAYLQPQTAASLLSAMPTPEAARILGSTDARAAASTIMELAPSHAVVLLAYRSDPKRAAAVLTHATSQTAIAVMRANREFARTVRPYLTEPLRTKANRALANESC